MTFDMETSDLCMSPLFLNILYCLIVFHLYVQQLV